MQFTRTSTNNSLEEVHTSIDPSLKKTKWGRILAFFGPAYLISVGYMDPGNWATDIAGGSKFGYTLLWVLLMSNLMALLLQSLSARLGIVSGRDLAQASREEYPRHITIVLYVLAEIAIAACDLAEVLGMAIGLKLLFHLPILYGVVITIFDTILLLFLQKFGMRKLEAFIISLIAIIGLSFFIELMYVKPSFTGIVGGFVPAIPDATALYITIGIIGATVMPHNLYLHSALVQTRRIGSGTKEIKKALKFNFYDSFIALNFAFLVNSAILVLAAAAFFTHGFTNLEDIEPAHAMLKQMFGNVAPVVFAVGLIAAGQSSTITGTLAGQVVMEGYLHLRLALWVRRLMTRLLAVVPAFFVIYFMGENESGNLLVLSQVILSLQLGFAIIPLIHFVSSKTRMGNYAIKLPLKLLSWLVAGAIIAFNVKLTLDSLVDWFSSPGAPPYVIKVIVILITLGLGFFLLWIIIRPLVAKGLRRSRESHKGLRGLNKIEPLDYKRIAITVDFSDLDNKAIGQALAAGGKNTEYLLIHVVESPGAIVMGQEIADHEAETDSKALEDYGKTLKEKGYKVSCRLVYGSRVEAIAETVNKFDSDLLVMGSHGHRAIKDMIFGETINSVRHKINIPLLAVK